MEVREQGQAVEILATWDGTVTGWMTRSGVRIEGERVKFWRGPGLWGGRRYHDVELRAPTRVVLSGRRWPSGLEVFAVHIDAERPVRAFASLFYVEARRAALAIGDALGVPVQDATPGLQVRVQGDDTGVARFSFEGTPPQLDAVPPGVEVSVHGEVAQLRLARWGVRWRHLALVPMALAVGLAVAGVMAWRMQGLPVVFGPARTIQAWLVLGGVAVLPGSIAALAVIRAARGRDVVRLARGRVEVSRPGRRRLQVVPDDLELIEVSDTPRGVVAGSLAVPVLFVGTGSGHREIGRGLDRAALTWVQAAVVAALRPEAPAPLPPPPPAPAEVNPAAPPPGTQ